MKLDYLSSAIAIAGLSFALGANAMTSAEHSKAEDILKADKKAALALCDGYQGSAKSLCKVEANGKYDIARAELDAQYKPSPKATQKVRDVKADVGYDIAKEKCGELSGNPKDVCLKDAKAAQVAAKADAKTAKVSAEAQAKTNDKVAQARTEAMNDKTDAAYAAAKERCDALAGDAKDRCQADVKAKFGKG